MADTKNPILYYRHGVAIRKNNQISVSVSEVEMLSLVDISKETGLSVPKIYALQGQACQKCGNANIVITIPKEILSTKRISAGKSIVELKQKKK